MATIETALFSLLSSDSAIGDFVEDRIYSGVMPSGRMVSDTWLPVIERNEVLMPPFDLTAYKAASAITFQQIAGVRSHTLTAPIGYVRSRWQVNCWGCEYADCRNVAAAVRKLLDGYEGTYGGIKLYCVELVSERDLLSLVADVRSLLRFGKALDFIIRFKEDLN